MSKKDLPLTAKEGNWRLFMVRKADPAFLDYQQQVFERDDYCCQYCGFRENTLQEIVNQDGDYYNNHLSNLVTACPFCAQCFFLEAIGKSDFGGGTLVYLPDIPQASLNALCHVLFAAIVSGNCHSNEAKNTYRNLKLLAQTVEKRLGEGMSNPALYGQLLIDSQYQEKEQFNKELSKSLRVLPQLTHFVAQIERWQLNALHALRQLPMQ